MNTLAAPPREFTNTGDEFVDIAIPGVFHVPPGPPVPPAEGPLQAAAPRQPRQFLATLKPEKVFTVVINGAPFSGMRQVGQWEGLLKLEGSLGSCIVADPRSPLRRGLDDAWDPQPTEWVVVKAGGKLLEAFVSLTDPLP